MPAGTELFNLAGKRALVTGSSRGLGHAIAEGLAEAGAEVILNGVHDGRLQEAVADFRDRGLAAQGYAFDVTDVDAVRRQVAAMESEVGPVDILVNNAGIQIRGPIVDYPLDQWRRLLDINLTGPFQVAQSVAAGMIERGGGKVINICSVQSELGRPTIAPYTASKGGIKMLTKAMAAEWGRHNIQANGLGPGYFVTELTQPLVDDPEFNAWLCNRTPANRWGQPRELKGAAVFLASAASDYVNGHILYVDGGLLSSV